MIRFSRTLLLLSILLMSSELCAFSLTEDFSKGFYWASFPISMNKFVVDASDGPMLQQMVNAAEDEWEDEIGRDIWNFEAGAIVSNNYSGNYIRWSNNFGQETGFDPVQTLALTTRYNTGTHLSRVVITLNGELGYLRQNFGNILLKVLIHELGHTIGLDHSDEQAIMAPYIGSLQTVQADDIEGINAVVDETIYRQSIGYISPLAGAESKEENQIGTCGTISMVDENTRPWDGMMFIASLLIGVFVTLAPSRFKSIFFRA